MSDPDDRPGRDEPGPAPMRPRRARALIVSVVAGAAVFVIAFMLLVSQCGTGDDGEVVGRGPAPVPASIGVPGAA